MKLNATALQSDVATQTGGRNRVGGVWPLDLERALQDLADDREAASLSCEVRCDLTRARLPAEMVTELVRIANQALKRAAMHPTIRSVRLVAVCDGEALALKIRDDGGGGDPIDEPLWAALDRAAEKLGGRMLVRRYRRGGCALQFRFPLHS